MATALEIAAGVRVEAAPEQVWQAAMDWSRQREWMWATTVHGGHGRGAEVVGRTGIGPIGFTDRMVIIEWDPPRRCVVEHTGRLIRGEGLFEVASHGDRSEFRWTERLLLPVPSAIGRVAGVLIRPLARWGLNSSLRRFARLVRPG